MRAIIIEDEMLAVSHLQSVLSEISDIQVIAVLDTIQAVIEWFEFNAQPDLVFMDIHLADGSAFKIFEHVNIISPIIFTTAYDEYAIKAFNVNSIDYLLKPITLQKVIKALDKLKSLTSKSGWQQEIQRLISSIAQVKLYKTHFLVPIKGSQLIPLLAKDIEYIHIESGLVKACTSGGSYVLENTMEELSDELNPYDFFRANRQYIIARNSIKEIDYWFNNRLSVNLKVCVPEKILISRVRVHDFRKWYSGI